MPKKKEPESKAVVACPKCGAPVEFDITKPIKALADTLEGRDKALAKELRDCLTGGLYKHEKTWNYYLENEIKPRWPILYDFLKGGTISHLDRRGSK